MLSMSPLGRVGRLSHCLLRPASKATALDRCTHRDIDGGLHNSRWRRISLCTLRRCLCPRFHSDSTMWGVGNASLQLPAITGIRHLPNE